MLREGLVKGRGYHVFYPYETGVGGVRVIKETLADIVIWILLAEVDQLWENSLRWAQ